MEFICPWMIFLINLVIFLAVALLNHFLEVDNKDVLDQAAQILKIKLKVTFEEILKGIEKKVKYKRRIPDPETTFINCKHCGGSGQVTRVTQSFLGHMRSTAVCPHCNGTGKQVGTRSRNAGPDGLILDEKTILIKIPPGIEDGNYMTFNGKGHFGHGGVNPGDLIVFFV